MRQKYLNSFVHAKKMITRLYTIEITKCLLTILHQKKKIIIIKIKQLFEWDALIISAVGCSRNFSLLILKLL